MKRDSSLRESKLKRDLSESVISAGDAGDKKEKKIKTKDKDRKSKRLEAAAVEQIAEE